MRTKAAILCQINKPLQIEELTLPKLKPGQVLVEVAYSGLCHSQLNEIRGLKGEDRYLPHTLGHEGSGIVKEIGPNVEKVKPGDRVVLTWIKGKGAEIPAALYKRNNGSFVNSGAISTFLTKAVISENRLVKIPKEMPLREAALLGCAIPTGAGIVMNTPGISSESSIVIFGMGGIGLSVLLAAKLKGARIIIATDVFDQKLKYALKLGATHTINAKKQDVLATIMSLTDRRGVDYAIEAVGKKETTETAFQTVRDKGGLCIVAGNLAYNEKISIDPFDLIKGKRIIGSWGGETEPDRDIPIYADLYLAGKLKLDEMVKHCFRFEDINNALTLLEKDEVGRIIIGF